MQGQGRLNPGKPTSLPAAPGRAVAEWAVCRDDRPALGLAGICWAPGPAPSLPGSWLPGRLSACFPSVPALVLIGDL